MRPTAASATSPTHRQLRRRGGSTPDARERRWVRRSETGAVHRAEVEDSRNFFLDKNRTMGLKVRILWDGVVCPPAAIPKSPAGLSPDLVPQLDPRRSRRRPGTAPQRHEGHEAIGGVELHHVQPRTIHCRESKVRPLIVALEVVAARWKSHASPLSCTTTILKAEMRERRRR